MEGTWNRIMRRFSRRETDEERQFKLLCRDLSTSADISAALDFYRDNFSQVPTAEFPVFIVQNLMDLFNASIPYFIANMKEMEPDFVFLRNCVKIFHAAKQFDKVWIQLFGFVKNYVLVGGGEISEKSIEFSRDLFEDPSFEQTICSPAFIIDVFDLFFVQVDDLISDLIIENCVIVVDKSSDFSLFYERVIDAFEKKEVKNFEKSLYFVAAVCGYLKDEAFIKQFLDLVAEDCSELDSFGFIAKLLDTNLDVTWQFLETAIRSEKTNKQVMNGLVAMLYERRNSEKAKEFNYTLFSPRIKCILQQRALVECVALQDESHRVEFLLSLVPPWEKDFKSVCFVWLLETVDNVDDFMLIILSKTQKEELGEIINEDENIGQAIFHVLQHLSADFPSWSAVTGDILFWVNHGVTGTEAWLDALTKLVTGECFAKSLIDIAQREEVCDAIWRAAAKVATANHQFVEVALADGVDVLLPQLNSPSSLDFAAGLVCNGPYEVVDEFVDSHKEIFSKFTEKQLRNLMMGLEQESDSYGALRMPSLCQFVQKCELRTPFDKYVYGTLAIRYSQQRMDCYSQAFDCGRNPTPEAIYAATNTTLPHCPVYQFHFDIPHGVAQVETEAAVSFWFYIEKIIGRTVIVSSSLGEISFNHDGLTIFDQEPIECELRKWHLITLNFSEPKSFLSIGGVFLDGVKVVQRGSVEYGPKTITFGSEEWNNGIWFLAPNVMINKAMLSKEQIDKLVECPPCYENQHESRIENVQPGCKYVDYKGLIVFLEGLGGEQGFFNKLREEQNERDFWFLFKSAFALREVKALTRSFFISAMRYVVSEHQYWFNDSKIAQAFNEDPLGLVEFLCDFQILSSPSLEFGFLPGMFARDLPLQKLFYFLLDCYSFFELKYVAESNIVESIARYIQKFPEYLPRVLLVIGAIQTCGAEAGESLKQETVDRRQDTICNLVLTYTSMLFDHVSCERLLDYCNVFPHKYGYQLLNAMIQHSMKDPDYVSVSDLRANTVYLVSLLQEEDDLWFALASLLKEKEVRSWRVSESDKFNPQKAKLTELVLDLVAYSIKEKLQRNLTPGTELKVIRFVYDLAGMDVLKSMPDTIIHICSLGYDWEAPNVMLTKSQSKLLNLKGKETIAPTRYLRLLRLDPEFSEASVAKIEDEIELPEAEKEKPFEVPTNLQQVVDSEEITLMTRVLANALALKLKSFMLSEKKVFSVYTIASSDIPSEVSVAMHQKVVQSILELPRQAITDDAWSLLFDFLSKMVLAKMWSEKEDKLAQLALPKVSAKMRYGRGFLVTCIEQCDCAVQCELLCTFFSTPSFLELLEDQSFVCAIERIVCQTELVSEPGFKKLGELIAKECDGTELAQAIKEDRVLEWYASVEDKFGKLQVGSPTQDWPAFPSDIIISKNVEVPFNSAIKTAEAELLMLALRRQFFYRLTKSNQELEDVIGQMFQRQALTQAVQTDATEFMVVEAPQPFTVPQKLVPLVYKFSPPETRHSRRLTIPHSIHQASLNTPIRELNRERIAPMCLEHWHLPTYVNGSVTAVLKETIGTNLKNCFLMSTVEELQCVYCLGKDSVSILMNASYSPDQDVVVLNELSDMLCHFAAFEIPLYGYYGSFRQFCHHTILTFKYTDVLLTINRRYAYRPTLVDIFLANGVHHTLNFATEYDRKLFLAKIRTEKKPATCGIHYAAQLLAKPLDMVTKMWQRGELSNFDYTVFLNIAGGRSFNDLTQYPVVPWILGDFTKDKPVRARDISKPMGAQSSDRAARYMNNYKETEYHYGTHYSHSAAVLHYMLRVEPYTLYGLHLHNGWDHKDRLFCSIAESWRSASEANQADVKELIPEFYCFPNMFENVNHLHLRERSDGHSLSTVELPKWARNAEDFVWTMRMALDTEERLNEWIDLIFGYKQQGEAAIDAVNVFHPLAYGSSFDESEYDEQDRKAAIDTIINFGQCPQQLFTSEHPARDVEVRLTVGQAADLRVTELTESQGVPHCVYVVDEGIIDSSPTEIAYDYPTKKAVLDTSVAAWCLSTDKTMCAIARRNFTIQICFAGGVMTTVLTRSNNTTCLALSSQHAILAAGAENELFLFDTTTGILMRRAMVTDPILAVEFDEAANFIVIVAKQKIVVFGLDLRLIAKASSEVDITCLSVGDSLVLEEKPSYFTGHIDGSISRWTLDVTHSELAHSSLSSQCDQPLATVHVFADNQALLAVHSNNRRFLHSVPAPRKRLLKVTYFPACAVCNTAKTASYCCSQCGLWICANCRASRGPLLCSACTNATDSQSYSSSTSSTSE